MHDLNKCHVVYNYNKGEIVLVIDEKHPDLNTVVKGNIISNPDLVAFGINQHKTRSAKEMMEFLKMNRLHFVDKALNANIVLSLQNFKGKVEKTFEDISDLRGNEKTLKMQKLEMDMAESFELSMPVYKGLDKATFKVNVYATVRDSAVEFYLESVELKELQDGLNVSLIDEQLEFFKEIVCIEE